MLHTSWAGHAPLSPVLEEQCIFASQELHLQLTPRSGSLKETLQRTQASSIIKTASLPRHVLLLSTLFTSNHVHRLFEPRKGNTRFDCPLVGKSDHPWYWLISLVGWKQKGKEGWKQTRDNYFWKHCQSASSIHCGWRFNVLMKPVGYCNECEEADGQNVSLLHKLCDGDHSQSRRVVDHLLFWRDLGSCNFGRSKVIDEWVIPERHSLLFSHRCNLRPRWGKTKLSEFKCL